MKWWFLLLAAVCVFGIARAIVVPSYSVKVCKNGQSCTRKLYATAYITNEASNYELEFVISTDQEISDESGRKWAPQAPIQLRFKRLDLRMEYMGYHTQTFRNAYEQVTTYSSPQSCPADARCCISDDRKKYLVYQLANNATDYRVFSVSSGTLKYSFVITATQGPTAISLTLSSSSPSGSIPGLAGTIMTDYVDPNSFIDFVSSSVVMEWTDSAPIEAAFAVPSWHLGSGRNQLGITSLSYLGAKKCGDPIGWMFAIEGTNIYDQMAAFRKNTVAQMRPCNFWPAKSIKGAETSIFAFTCDYVGTMSLILELDTTNIALRKLFGEPLITNSGLLPFSLDSRDATLYVDITNKGDSEGTFELQPKQCCINQTQPEGGTNANCSILAIQSAVSHSIQPSETLRFKFLVRSEVIIRKEGFCEFAVVQHGITDITHRVQFNTNTFLPEGDPITDSAQCEPPNLIVTQGGRKFCQKPCTRDQAFSQSSQVCEPVDCVVKYLGTKDYFNVRDGLCEPRVICAENQETDVVNNRCYNPNVQTPNITTPDPSNSSDSYLEDTTPPDPYESIADILRLIPPPDCGLHGRLDPSNTTCICDEGYKVLAYDTWCLYVDTSTPSNVDFSPLNAWRLVGNNEILILIGSVGGGLAVISAMFMTCALLLIRRHVQKKREAQRHHDLFYNPKRWDRVTRLSSKRGGRDKAKSRRSRSADKYHMHKKAEAPRPKRSHSSPPSRPSTDSMSSRRSKLSKQPIIGRERRQKLTADLSFSSTEPHANSANHESSSHNPNPSLQRKRSIAQADVPGRKGGLLSMVE